MRPSFLLLFAFGMAACSDDLVQVPEADQVALSAAVVKLAPEEQGALAFTLLAEDGSLVLPTDAVWISRDPGVVTVDSVGTLLANTEGTTYVVLNVSGLRDSVPVVVQRDWIAAPNHPNWCRLQGNGVMYCAGLLRASPTGSFAVWGHSQSGAQCVIAAGGVIHCRGSNWSGALGDGSPMDTSYSNVTRDGFGPVSGPGGYDEIIGYSGQTFCGLRGGEVRCWGYDAYGSLGNDTARASVGVPTVVAGGLTFTSLAEEVYDPELCGTAGGRLWCWGGYGSAVALRTPQAVTPDLDLVRASRGAYHTCALDSDGMAWCWGYNNDGELGRGTVGPEWVSDSVPAPVVTDLRFVDIMVYFGYTCGVSVAGELWCWGSGTQGQLGVPGLRRSSLPVRISSPQRFATIHRGYSSGVCALTVGGAEYCWGGLSPNLDTKPEDYLPRRTPAPF